jgi:hypothetical protein
MELLAFMFPVGAIVGAIVGAGSNRTRDGAILGLVLGFIGVVIVVCMDPRPVAAGGARRGSAARRETPRFIRIEDSSPQSVSEAGHTVAA